METVEIKHFHFCAGSGGGAKGFNNAQAALENLRARFRCIGGIDVDPAGIRDFERLTGTKGTVLDLFDRQQYIDFHGHEPPAGWCEASTDDIRRAAGNESPNLVFISAPCKGNSGLLSESRSLSPKYQALNRLALRSVFLMCEAFGDDPPEFILFENVPRIMQRSRHLLDQILTMLRAYGYAVTETTHDCGEIGGLAQSRKRYLMVARNIAKVPPFLYEPIKRPLRAVGEVLSQLPIPGTGLGGPMHRVPALQWKTWVRLAFVQAGSDWRSLNRLAVQDGYLRDYLIVPEMHNGVLGVTPWGEPSGTVTGNSRPATGKFSVADPRFAGAEYSQYGVRRWSEAAATVTSQRAPGQGPFSVADPRASGTRHNNVFRVVRFDQPSPAVTGGTGPSSGGLAVADPRAEARVHGWGVLPFDKPSGCIGGQTLPSNGRYSVADPRFHNWHPGASSAKMRITTWHEPCRCVTGSQQVGSGAGAVADPRLGWGENRAHYNGGGHYGVVPWDSHAGAVSGAAGHDNGRWSVADPRLPEATEQLVCRIIAEDGTWHRPFTTLELAALQGLVDPEEEFRLDGESDSAWRERIGNAVPPPAAAAIGGVMGRAILMARKGQTFALSSTDIWVRPMAVALSVHQGAQC